jgi:IPT/TIG domain
MPDFELDVSLDVKLPFTGTSATTGAQGVFADIGVEVNDPPFQHDGGPLQVEFSGFNFDFPSPSWMGLDLRLTVNHVPTGAYYRIAPDARANPNMLRCAWSPPVPAGQVDVKIEGRAVLYGGPPPIPPASFHVSGAATLKLTSTATPKTLTVSPAEFVIDAGGGQGVDVLLSSPATEPFLISAASQKGLVFTYDNGGQTIPVGSNKGGFVIQTETGGTDIVTVSVNGFVPATVTVHVRPVLSSLQPTAGSPNLDVTLVGAGFAAGAEAVIGNNPRPATLVDSEHLTTRFAPFGAGPISVAAAVNGQQSATSLTFTIVPDIPVITGFSPNTGTTRLPVTITGTHFSNASAVQFNGVASVFTVTSDTAIATTVPDAATTGRITVVTPLGSAVSIADFTVLPPPPVITRFEPSSSEVGGSVAIYGDNFETVTQVSFAGVPAKLGDFAPPMLGATVPDQARTGPITVVSKGGEATSSTPFTVLPVTPPTITDFFPTSGPPGTDYILIRIGGSHFRYVSDVRITGVQFNGVAAQFSVNSDLLILALVPPGATSGPITLTSVAGSVTSAASFTVVDAAAAGTLSFSNDTYPADTVTIWAIDYPTNDKVGVTLAPGESSHTATLNTGNLYQYLATSHALVLDYNERFGKSLDPEAYETAQIVNFQRASGFVQGQDNGQPDTVSIT